MSRNIAASKKRKTTPPLGGDDSAQDVIDEIAQNKRPRPLGGAGQPTGDKQFYESKLAELEEELKLLKNGEHQELVEKIKQLDKKKKDDLQKASLLRELKTKEIEAMYEFSVQEANDVFNGRKKELQERLLLDTEEAIKRIKELRDGAAKKKGGRGRSGSMNAPDDETSQEDEEQGAANQAGSDEQDDNAGVPNAGTKKSLRSAQGTEKKGLNAGEINIQFAAPPDAILDDLAKIHADWMKRAEAFQSKEEILNMAVRVEDGKLYFNEHIIEKGSSVIVHSEPTAEDMFGMVTKITPTEIYIRLAGGGPSRLPIAQLKSGRCKIVRDTRKDPSIPAQ